MSSKLPENTFGKIGAPATRALAGIRVTSLEQLTQLTEAELLKLHGFGPKALRILKEKMAENNLNFGASH